MLFGKPPRIAKFHPNWSSGTGGVRGNKVLNNGRYYWEILLPRRIFGTSMMFGIGNSPSQIGITLPVIKLNLLRYKKG